MLPPILILAGLGTSLIVTRSRTRNRADPAIDVAALAADTIADPETTGSELAELAAALRSEHADLAALLDQAAHRRQAPRSGADEAPTPAAPAPEPAPGIDPKRAAVARLMGEWRAAGGNDLAVIALSPGLLCDVRTALGLSAGERDSERYTFDLALACQAIDPGAPAGHPIASGDPLEASRAACEAP